MQLAMIGLGKMGGNMTSRLLQAGHQVAVYDLNPITVEAAEAEGATSIAALAELRHVLTAPRIVWLMIPAGAPVEATLTELATILEPGDVIIDGGNSRFHDTLRRAAELAEQGLNLVDAGTSGGIWGLTEGYCLMVGAASPNVFALIEPALQALAPAGGYAHVGRTGAGHYVKMIHNGIEYALMQSYAEGFDLLQASQFEFDLGQVAQLWQHGSVIRSWLLELTAGMLERNPVLDNIRPWVADSGEGRWTVQEAIDQAVPAPVIALALMQRFASRQDNSFADRLLAGLRHEFGGHAIKTK